MSELAVTERLVETFPFFSSLPHRSREEVFSHAVSRKLAHKQVLASGGAECAFLPFVLEGTLRIYKASEAGREITLYRIQRGESCVLSATCILNGGGFPAIAEAEGDTEVVLLPARLLARLVEDNPQWRRFMFDLYAKRLESMLTLVEEVAFRHMDLRLAAYLVRQAGQRQKVVTRTHGEIAAELGTSREVVTRILSDFEAGGLIGTARGRIRIHRPDALREKGAPYSVV
ncbi:MAG: Crp/Fnr family transcriptional regulator [Spirochaetia bacterium]